MIDLQKGDCLEIMKDIPDKSIDAIICDLPYGTTACKWDVVIPFEPLWAQYKRIIKDNGAIVLFGSQPFTSALVMSNPKWFKYSLVWEKSNPTGMGQANKRPMKYHEDICVFYFKQPTYNKQMIPRLNKSMEQHIKNNGTFNVSNKTSGNQQSIAYKEIPANRYSATEKNPSSIIKINSLRANSKEWCDHPTQKPLDLMKYLIKTYTNEGETVLDNTMGSGTTGVAAVNLNRNFIGIEMDEHYFEIAEKRIGGAKNIEHDKQQTFSF